MTLAPPAKQPPRPQLGRGGLAQVLRRLGWGVADQGIASLSNFALGLFVARSFGASSFGAFALAFVTYTVVMNAARGLATDPLLVRFSGAESGPWRRAVSCSYRNLPPVGRGRRDPERCRRTPVARSLGPVFVALGIALPGLAVQDSWRFAFFAAHRGASAFINDLFWTVLLVLALVGLHAARRCHRSDLPARLRRDRHGRCRAGRGAGSDDPPPAAGSGVASRPLRLVGSVSARERQHQRGGTDPGLRAGWRSESRCGRSRTGLRNIDGPVLRRADGGQPSRCSGSVTGLSAGPDPPQPILPPAGGCSGGRRRSCGG